jgi:hypothetical protein
MTRFITEEGARIEARGRAKGRPGTAYLVAHQDGVVPSRPWRVLTLKGYRRALVLPASWAVVYTEQYGYREFQTVAEARTYEDQAAVGFAFYDKE